MQRRGIPDPPEPFVAGVLLAAGAGRRLGGSIPKPLLEVAGTPLVRRAADALLGAELAQTLAVVGSSADRVRAVLAGLAIEVVENPTWETGQSTSVRCGLTHLDRRARAVLFAPCDQPYLDVATIEHLLDVYRRTGGPIVAPRFGDRPGAPVILDRSVFPDVEALVGDTGARVLIARRPNDVRWVDLDDERPLIDVDTASHLSALDQSS